MGELFDKIRSKKHKTFILYYMKYQNGTLAYSKTYPTAKNTTCRANATKLLAKAHISRAIQEMLDELWENKKNDISRMYQNLVYMATADIKDVVDYKNGKLIIKDFEGIDTRAVQSIQHIITENETQYGTNYNEKKSVKMFDKTKSLSDLLKVLKMIDTTVEIDDIIIKPARRPDVSNENKTESNS